MALLPDGDRAVGSCSPLEGDCRPRAGKLQPDPQGSGFLLGQSSAAVEIARAIRTGAYCWSRPAISACHGATHRSIAPTRKFSETAINMMMMMGTKVVAVSKLLAEVWMIAPSPEIEGKNSAI